MTHKANPRMGQSAIVYVREADPEQLPDKLKGVPGKVFSVHDHDGRCLALAQDRSIAFALARRNDLTPVSVH